MSEQSTQRKKRERSDNTLDSVSPNKKASLVSDNSQHDKKDNQNNTEGYSGYYDPNYYQVSN